MSRMIKQISDFFSRMDVSRPLLKQIPEEHLVHEVLLVGLNHQAAERCARKRFPKAHVTILENPLASFEGEKNTFDLVLVNVYLEHIRFSVSDKEQIALRLSKWLERDGYLAINFFGQPLLTSSVFDRLLSKWEQWSFLKNQYALYRHFGQGQVGDPVPEGYTDRQQSRMNLEACTGSSKHYEIIGDPGRIGLRAKIGPFVSEDYFTDEEPVLEPFHLPRTIKWQPFTVSKKTGWKRHPLPGDIYQKGVGLIRSDNQDSYWKEWTAHAQRHRSKWLKDERYEIVDVTLDEFAHAYHASKKLDWLTRTGFVRVLKFHQDHQPHVLRLFGARDLQTNQIVAGLALMQLDDIAQSFHTVSFICDHVRQTSVGVGLIDHWYKRGIVEGVRFFNFGIVWREGDPGAWKGYSKFKRQFNLYLIAYPKPLLKYVWGKNTPHQPTA